jgi:hypothetical protein
MKSGEESPRLSKYCESVMMTRTKLYRDMPSKTLLSWSTVRPKSVTFCEREFLRERGVRFAPSVCAAEAITGFDDDREIKQRSRSSLDDEGPSRTT